MTGQEETILLLGQVQANYPGVSTELIGEAYIDACLEINSMSFEEKRSFVNEMIEMTKKFQEPCEEDAVIEN